MRRTEFALAAYVTVAPLAFISALLNPPKVVAEESLHERLVSSDQRTRLAARKVFRSLADEARMPVLQAMVAEILRAANERTPEANVRGRFASEVFPLVGGEASWTIPSLIGPAIDPGVPWEAAGAARAALGGIGEPVLPSIQALFSDPLLVHRQAALRIVGSMRPIPDSAIPYIKSLLKDGNDSISMEAKGVLAFAESSVNTPEAVKDHLTTEEQHEKLVQTLGQEIQKHAAEQRQLTKDALEVEASELHLRKLFRGSAWLIIGVILGGLIIRFCRFSQWFS